MSEVSGEKELIEPLSPCRIENPPQVTIDLPKPIGIKEFNLKATEAAPLNMSLPFDVNIMQRAQLERDKKRWKEQANFKAPTRDQLILYDMRPVLSVPPPTIYGRKQTKPEI
jgi:hypothetical protein